MISNSPYMLQTKIRPILPIQTCVDSKYSLYQFLKKGYKILPDVKIAFGNDKFFRNYNERRHKRPNTLRLFKTLKFAQKFNFTKPSMYPNREFTWERRMLVAKRMSNSRTVSIGDLKSMFAIWTQYMKRAKTFKYQYLLVSLANPIDYSNYSSAYARFLKYKSLTLKNLTLVLPEHDSNSDDDAREKFKLEHFPATLERLSLKNVNDSDITLTSLTHLKNLKHFEVVFDENSRDVFVISTLNLLAPLSENLQSLSIKWPRSWLNPVPKWINSLKNLTKLKLDIPSTFDPDNILDLQQILEGFEECILNHLHLKLSIRSEEFLSPISNFIAKNPNLKSLKLYICSQILMDLEPAQELFDQIDNLPLLTRLSVAIFKMTSKKANLFPQFPTLFPKIFSKPIPLETFKIKLSPLEISNQEFFQLLKSLEPRISTLNKLKLDIGLYTPKKDELATVLEFIRNLKNIRSLKLDSIMTTNKQALTELSEAVCSLKYLTVLRIGQVKWTVKRLAFVQSLERVLQKRGLRKLDCRVHSSFAEQLEIGERGRNYNLCIDQANIEKKNPSICHFPELAIYKIQDYELW